MAETTRYRIDGTYGWTYGGMEKDDMGSWVKYDDHLDALAARTAERDELRGHLNQVYEELGSIVDGEYIAIELAQLATARIKRAEAALATAREDLEAVRRVQAWLWAEPARRQVRMVSGKLQAVEDVSMRVSPHWRVVTSAPDLPALGRALAAQDTNNPTQDTEHAD